MVDSHYVTVSGDLTTVEFDRNYKLVEICSLDGNAAFSVLVDPEDGEEISFAQDGTIPMPAAPCSRRVESPSQANTVVQLRSDGDEVSVCVLPA